jgi:F-type H+-transporting ATPase subunit alpha
MSSDATFLELCRTSHKDLLANIAKEGKITEDADAKLKKLVSEFLIGFTS